MQLVASVALQFAVLAVLGAGSQTDVWVAAQAAPLVLFSIMSVALQGAWQSRFAVVAHQPSQWLQLQRTAQGQLLLILGGATVAVAVSTRLWVPPLFPGLASAQLDLTERMTRVLLIGTLFNGQAALFTSALRARGHFVAPEAIALAGSVAAIALVVVGVRRYGIEAAAWISLARSLTVSAALFVMARWPWPSLSVARQDQEGWRLMRPILLGSSFYKTGPLVDRFWSSLAPSGSMTLFSLAQTGMGALAMVLERSLSMPATPSLARLAAAKNYAGMRSLYRQSIVRVFAASAVVMLVLITTYPAWPSFVALLLKLDEASARQAWWLCLLLVGYMYPSAAGSTLVSSFYALGDTRTPAQVGVIGFALSLVWKAVGFLNAGVVGLAVATAAHYLANMLLLNWLLERRLRSLQ